MEDIITSIAADQSSGLVSLVLSRAADEIQFTLNLKDDLKDLGHQLKKLQMIIYGEQSAVALRRNPLIRTWLADVKNIAYEADDLLDDYAGESFRLSLLREKKSTTCFISFLECISSLIDPIIFRCNMAHRVKDLRISIATTYKDAQDLGIKLVELTEARPKEITRYTSMTDSNSRLELERENPDASDLIGRDHDVDYIVNAICDSSNMVNGGFQLLAVVGSAGLGKTTLLKNISRDTRVLGCFKERIIWICVSYHFNPRDFLVKMAEQLLGECKTFDQHAILKNLNSKLSNHSCLIILDDVWNTMTYRLWETVVGWLKEICHPLGHPTVLASTRSNEVARIMQSGSVGDLIYPLRGLSKEDSWSLFCRRLTVYKNMEDISRRMVNKCKGVPLAIKVLASTLKTRRNEEWVEIEQTKIWHLDDNEGIMPSLRLSYDYLPNMAIKRCFGYCAIFEEDAKIERENLIQLWVAQGLIEPSQEGTNKSSLERIGDRYFNILLNNSLFQDIEEDDCRYVRSCKMHDAVWALAQQVSDGEWLTLNQDVQELNSDSKTWHVHVASEINVDQIEPNNKRVRTMVFRDAFCDSTAIDNVLKCVENLRVLCLVGMELEYLPRIVGNMKHLRYLDISKNNFCVLPLSAITDLWSLQTFRCIQYYPELEIPPDFEWYKLVSIRHIILDDDTKIPFPKAISQLTCLETVPSLCLADAPGKISDLGPLTGIRGKLELRDLEQVNGEEEASEAKLGEKSNISELYLIWRERQSGGDNDEQVLKALQPHQNLKVLQIENYLGKALPRWLIEMEAYEGSIFSSLLSLKIIGCKKIVALTFSSTILQNLKILEVKDCPMLTCVNVGYFPCLLNLSFIDCSSLSSISTSSTILGAFRDLKVENCPRLTGVDMSYFPCLLNLSFIKCDSLSSISTSSIIFGALKSLKVRTCESLTGLDVSYFPCLLELSVEDCSNISSISTSSTILGTLRSLKVIKCYSLTGLDVSYFPCLLDLSIRDCSNISSISTSSTILGALRSLNVSMCDSLTGLDVSYFPCLLDLSVRDCSNISSISTSSTILGALRSLNVSMCDSLTGLDVSNFPCLLELSVEYCSNISSISTSSTILGALRSLNVRMCDSLTGLDVSNFPCLLNLSIGYCRSLSSISTSSTILGALTSLKVDSCPSLTGLDVSCFPSLLELYIDHCDELSCISSNIGFKSCTMLQSIIIPFCPSLESIPHLKSLQNLNELSISICICKIGGIKDLPNLKSLEFGSNEKRHDCFLFEEESGGPDNDDEENVIIPLCSTSLKELCLYGWETLVTLPSMFQHCTALEILSIQNYCDLEALPIWIGNLESLEELWLEDLPKAKFLPPRNKTVHLVVTNCPLLPKDVQGYEY